MKNIIITGASGYLGQAITERLNSEGYTLTSSTNSEGKPWRLGDNINDDQLLKADLILHIAWNLQIEDSSSSHLINERGTKIILDQARDKGVEFLFISSMSSYEDCVSVYGRSKFAVEKLVLDQRGIVVRPGLIWSNKKLSGILATFAKLVDILPVVPYVTGAKAPLYLVSREELCHHIICLIESIEINKNKIITIANTKPYTIKDILIKMSLSKKRRLYLFRIDISILKLILTILGLFGIKIFKKDSLIGLEFANENPIINFPAKYDFLDQ